MQTFRSSVAAARRENQARLASFAAPLPINDVPADFAPFVGSGSSAMLEALRALAAAPKAALPGLIKDGVDRSAMKRRAAFEPR